MKQQMHPDAIDSIQSALSDLHEFVDFGGLRRAYEGQRPHEVEALDTLARACDLVREATANVTNLVMGRNAA